MHLAAVLGQHQGVPQHLEDAALELLPATPDAAKAARWAPGRARAPQPFPTEKPTAVFLTLTKYRTMFEHGMQGYDY